MKTHASRNITTQGSSPYGDYLSTYEVAQLLDRAPDSVRLMARKGRLRTAIQTRTGRLFLRADVEALAKQLPPSVRERGRLRK